MLKKCTLFFALIILGANNLSAQSLSIGPMAGINYSTTSNFNNTKYLLGPAFGLFANYSVNEHVGIGAKLLYSQLGTGYTNFENINRLQYLQLPISGIYYFGNAGDHFRPKIYGGPYIGKLLKANYKNGSEVVEKNGSPTYKSIDLGIQFGTGFNYLIKSRTWLNVDAGFGTSFSTVQNSAESKNRNFSLSAGISFPVSGM